MDGKRSLWITWACALHRWSKRHSTDVRDNTRTGGGLLFNGECCSLVDHWKHSQLRGMDTPSQHEPQHTARSSQWAPHFFENKRAWHCKHAVINIRRKRTLTGEEHLINHIPTTNLSLVRGQAAFILHWLSCSRTPHSLNCCRPTSAPLTEMLHSN